MKKKKHPLNPINMIIVLFYIFICFLSDTQPIQMVGSNLVYSVNFALHSGGLIQFQRPMAVTFT